MVGRSQKRKGRKDLLGNHQKCWIWGKNVVHETMHANRWRILELIVSDQLSQTEIDALSDAARLRQIPLSTQSTNELTRRCQGRRDHQGYAAKMSPYPYLSPDEILSQKKSSPFYIVLDAVQDPYNFGAIIRSADVFGVDAVFVGCENQCEVNSLVARTSAGAVNYVSIAQATDLVQLVSNLNDLGIATYAASVEGNDELAALNTAQGVAIVIGNEGAGIDTSLAGVCSDRVSIAEHGSISSLNAAVAAGILMYETRRQIEQQRQAPGGLRGD